MVGEAEPGPGLAIQLRRRAGPWCSGEQSLRSQPSRPQLLLLRLLHMCALPAALLRALHKPILGCLHAPDRCPSNWGGFCRRSGTGQAYTACPYAPPPQPHFQ